MARHNIAGSEALGRPRGYIVQEVQRGRPTSGQIIRWHLIMAGAGGALALIDGMLGAPICLTVAVVGLFIWARTPDRR